MFNWLGNLFPYSDLHSLNLDWLLSKMKETATQAAQAIADSAKALAQVIEAKIAAQNAQTAAENAQTAAENAQTAANNAADSAENAVNVAQAAKSAAQNAQTTAQNAQTTAQNAQTAAQNAQTAAQNAQTTANSAVETANTLSAKFPIKTADIASESVTTDKLKTKTVNMLDSVSRAQINAPVAEIADEHIINTGSFFDNYKQRFLQFYVTMNKATGLAENLIDFSFPLVGTPAKDATVLNVGETICSPMIVYDNSANTLHNGYVRASRTADTKLKIKLTFTDTPPTFVEGTTFTIGIKGVYGYIQNINF